MDAGIAGLRSSSPHHHSVSGALGGVRPITYKKNTPKKGAFVRLTADKFPTDYFPRKLAQKLHRKGFVENFMVTSEYKHLKRFITDGKDTSRWLHTTNHKEIGLAYIFFGSLCGIIGSILS